MGLTERIRRIAAEHGHTFASLERSLSFGQGTIRKWDKNSPSCDKLLQVANLLSVSTDFLLTGIYNRSSNEMSTFSQEALEIANEWQKLDDRGRAIIKGEILKRVERIERMKACNDAESSCELSPYSASTTHLPVLGRAAAGIPIEMIVTDDSLDLDDLAAIQSSDFAVVAVGDSMIGAGIRDGDYVLIHQQPDVEQGEVALVRIDDGSTIKRFYREGNRVRLEPANPAHKAQVYGPKTEVHVLGKVVRVLHAYTPKNA